MKTLTTLALLIVALPVLPLLAQAQSQEPRTVVYVDQFYLGLYPGGEPLEVQAQGATISVPLRFGKVRVWGAINPFDRDKQTINMGGIELSYLLNPKAKTYYWRLNLGTGLAYDSQGKDIISAYSAVNLLIDLGSNTAVELVVGPALGHYKTKAYGSGTAVGAFARAGIKLPF